MPGELLVSFFDRDEAASRLVERLRGETIDGIDHVQSLGEKLEEAHTGLGAELELEFHLLRVPEGQEQWAVTHLQFLYGVESRQTGPDEDLASRLSLPEYNFTVVPNGVLSLPGADGGAASVRAANFAFEPIHDTYKGMLGLSGAPAGAEQTTVAILDSGIADDVFTNPHLSEKFNNISNAQCRNFIDPNASSEVTDENGHGTVVARIINDVAPHASLKIGKVADASGRATEWDTLAAIASARADVINLSLQFGLKDRPCGECGHQSRSSRSAVFSNMIGQIHRNAPRMPLFVAAAGNVNLPAAPDGELAFPSRFADVLAIGSINSRWELSSFSFYGNRDHEGNAHQNHYVMPGGEPNGAAAESIGSFGVGDGPHYGTSFAAAYASGMIARSIGEQRPLGYVWPVDLLQTLRKQADLSNLRDYTSERFGNGVLRL